MNEELQKLFEGQELSADFTSKVEGILEAKITEATVQIQEKAEQEAEAKWSKISEDYSQYVVSEMEVKTSEYVESEFIPVVEKYLNYAVEQFMKENKLVIESETKVELAEAFLKGLSGIAENYNVMIPEGQDDVVSNLKNQLKEANKKFETAIDEINQLKEDKVAYVKADIIEEMVDGMVETKKEKITEAAKSIKFVNEDQFKEAVAELKESFAPLNEKEDDKKKVDDKEVDESDEEGEDEDDKKMNESKKGYMNSLLSSL